jgi:ABC-type ATPase with predicted acetyltransferase domain
MPVYTINKRFTTDVERTERVLEIAESFGLGLDDKEFVLFDNQAIEIRQGDIVYITGQSGSGKSTVLRELVDQMEGEGLKVSNIDETTLVPRPIIDQIGDDLNEALRLLSVAGLNDANLFIRKPVELSDGQRYRFRLAKLIEEKAQVWVADEFLAILDRDSAKVIAYDMQKIARSVNATLIVATTHQDIEHDLAPNVTVEKGYREKVNIRVSREPEMP